MKTIQEKIVEAYANNDLELLEDIFVRKKIADPLLVTDMEKWNYLHRSLLYFHPSVDIIELFIKLGIDVNAQDIYGMTPLHYAMQGKNVDAAIALLNAGADPNIEDIDTSTPLAYINGMPKELALLSLMLEKGGNVHHFNGQHGILEGIKKYRINNPDFKPVIELMEKYA